MIDASVVVKWFSSENEDYVSEADGVRLAIRRQEITAVAPDLLLYEVLNALIKGKRLQLDHMGIALEVFFNIIDSELKLKKIDIDLSRQAVKLADKFAITFYDAVYLALAQALNIPLLSANIRHHQKQKDIKVVHLKDLTW